MSRNLLITPRAGTAAQWTAANPILAANEFGLETDTRQGKYGDGVTAWASLPYAFPSSAGTPLNDMSPLTGQETLDRRYGATNTALGLASGTMVVTYFKATRSEAVNSIFFHTGATAAAATPTLVRFGLYASDSTGALTSLVCSTANDTTLFAAATTGYSKATTAAGSITAGLFYGVAVLVVSAATMPSLLGSSPSLPNSAVMSSLAPRLVSRIGSLSDLPASATVGSLSGNSQLAYARTAP